MSNPTDKDLQYIRQQIDAIDQQLQILLNQRAQCAFEVAHIKQKSNNKTVYRPEREAQVLRKITEQSQGPLPDQDLAEIFSLIMAKCRRLQQPLRIAYLNNKQSAAHTATLKQFGPDIKLISGKTIHEVFEQVRLNKADYGVIPIENSANGIVTETLTELAQQSLLICAEIVLSASELKKSTATDYTRFIVISKDSTAPSGKDKTSLLISIANQPGSLAKIFQPFANQGVNITFIGAHPSPKQLWGYLFFVDIEGHQEDTAVQKALDELAKQPLSYTLLGSYPKSIYN